MELWGRGRYLGSRYLREVLVCGNGGGREGVVTFDDYGGNRVNILCYKIAGETQFTSWYTNYSISIEFENNTIPPYYPVSTPYVFLSVLLSILLCMCFQAILTMIISAVMILPGFPKNTSISSRTSALL